MSARSTLRSVLERSFGEHYPLISGTVDSMGSTTTLTDATRTESSDRWNSKHIYLSSASGTAPDDEERMITDFVSASTITVDVAFTSSAGAGYNYYIRERARKVDYDDAINEAIRKGRQAFLEELVDDTTVIIYDDQLDYTLPSGCEHIYGLWLERADVAASGTVSSATSTSLTDENQSWDTDEFNSVSSSYAVVIVDGAGQGQQRTITDTTSDTITVAEWTTTPDTTSEYKIKYIGEVENRWRPIRRFSLRTNTSSGTKTKSVQFGTQYLSGMSVRVHYAGYPSVLSSDSSSTSVPDEYIRNEGLAYLWELLGNTVSDIGDQSKDAMAMAEFYHVQAQRYAEEHGYVVPSTRIIEPVGGGPYYDDEYPFRRR